MGEMDIMLLFKKFTIIFLLVALMATAAAVEPVQLGGGRADEAINLQSGARQPGYVPRMTTSGFASPQTAQTMALDPGAMVHQAGVFMQEALEARDQTLAARDSALEARNRTEALAEEARTNGELAKAAQVKAAESRESCALGATMSQDYANQSRTAALEVQEVYNQAMNLTLGLENLTEQLKMAEQQSMNLNETAPSGLNASSGSGTLARDLEDLRIRLQDLDRRLAAVEDRISTADRLAGGT
ncbi:MAG: hypothetical protein GKC10_07770 [Methanosarcinales archaeon]|nr:hypothetical protein [Methanosarcinales archaeon]